MSDPGAAPVVELRGVDVPPFYAGLIGRQAMELRRAGRVVIPMHFDCFAENTIDPQEFLRLLGDAPAIKPVVMKFNESYLYTRPADQ